MKLNQILGYPDGLNIELYRSYFSNLKREPGGVMKTKDRNKVKHRWAKIKGVMPKDGTPEPDVVVYGTTASTGNPNGGN